MIKHATTDPDHPALIDIAIGEDGARYRLGVRDGMPWLWLFDCTGDDALVHFEPAAFSQFRFDCSRVLVASGRTGAKFDADVIVNSLRIVLARVDEFKKVSPAEVARLYAMVLNHIKASCPEALREIREGM